MFSRDGRVDWVGVVALGRGRWSLEVKEGEAAPSLSEEFVQITPFSLAAIENRPSTTSPRQQRLYNPSQQARESSSDNFLLLRDDRPLGHSLFFSESLAWADRSSRSFAWF